MSVTRGVQVLESSPRALAELALVRAWQRVARVQQAIESEPTPMLYAWIQRTIHALRTELMSELAGIGTWMVRTRSQRPARDVSGNKIVLPAQRVVTFSASRRLKEAVDQGWSDEEATITRVRGADARVAGWLFDRLVDGCATRPLPGFGTFVRVYLPPYVGTDRMTGGELTYPGQTTIRFEGDPTLFAHGAR